MTFFSELAARIDDIRVARGTSARYRGVDGQVPSYYGILRDLDEIYRASGKKQAAVLFAEDQEDAKKVVRKVANPDDYDIDLVSSIDRPPTGEYDMVIIMRDYTDAVRTNITFKNYIKLLKRYSFFIYPDGDVGRPDETNDIMKGGLQEGDARTDQIIDEDNRIWKIAVKNRDVDQKVLRGGFRDEGQWYN